MFKARYPKLATEPFLKLGGLWDEPSACAPPSTVNCTREGR